MLKSNIPIIPTPVNNNENNNNWKTFSVLPLFFNIFSILPVEKKELNSLCLPFGNTIKLGLMKFGDKSFFIPI